MEGTSVSAVHGYPLRPPGFEEPLFPTRNSKRAVMEHLARAPWLFRGSELSCGGGEVAHRYEEPAHVLRRRGDGRAYLVRRCPNGRRKGSLRKRRVVRVLERWREVARWWEEGRSVDRLVFRVLLSGGAVVDLALERSGGWFLVGVAD